jgi:glycosyltransferase-like protein
MNDPYGTSRVIARPLSIGLYTHSTQPRGSLLHCAALADALHAQGQSVTVYALHEAGTEPFFRELRARLVLIPASPAPPQIDRLVGQRIGELESFLAQNPPGHDVHHAQDCLTGSALIHSRPALGAAVARTVHHVERFDSPYLEHCQAQSIRAADMVLSVSDATRDEVLSRYRISSERVESGVESARFAMPPARDVVELGARLGLSSAGPVLVSYGGIEQRKNSVGVLEAFLAVRKRLPRACWVIIGGGSPFDQPAYREEFRRVLANASEADQRSVLMAGMLSEAELLASYQLADAVICAAHKEGFGTCALDALAAGAPLIASRKAPFTEYLDERCATLVDPNSHQELCAALWSVLLRGRNDHARLSSGIERAKRFTWSRAATDHVRLYRQLPARGNQRQSSPPSSKRVRALG